MSNPQRRRQTDKPMKWIEKYWKILLAVIATSTVLGTVVKPTWKWVVWDACAEPKCEQMIENKVGKKLDRLIENVEFQTFVQVRLTDYKDLEQLQKEWTSLKRGDK